MKMVCDDRTLREVANEFLALKKAQKVRERTLSDYKKYIDKFLEQSQNSLDVDVLKVDILEYFADIPQTSPARFNHPYQYLHALFSWAAKQDYIVFVHDSIAPALEAALIVAGRNFSASSIITYF
jgi:hypothetical protein